MSRPIRVLVLVKGLGRGGAERLVASGVRHRSDRLEVEVAYVLPHKDALVAEIEASGVRVHCLGGGRLGWVLALRRLVRGRGYDLVHTHMPVPAVAARLALGPGTPPIVHTEHNTWERHAPATRAANALTYWRNRRVLAVSEAVARSITPPWWLPRPPIEVLLHGIEAETSPRGPSAAAAARRAMGIGAGARVVGTVGNLTAKKDQAGLLHAYQRLLEGWGPEEPPVHLVLIGSGPLDQELRATAAALGLGDRAHFLGMRSDVPALLPGFDVFALSSRHEGLPIALLEALSAEVACVSTEVGGVPEVLTHGVDGLLVAPGDPQALAEAIGAVLLDPELRSRLSARGRLTASRFEIGRAIEVQEQVYQAVLS